MNVVTRLIAVAILLPVIISVQACGNNESSAGDAETVERQQSRERQPDARRETPVGEDGAVVLMYHRFGEDRYPSTSIRMKQFRHHLEYLEENDFNIWPLERVVEYLLEGKRFPERTVAITIDDAYPSTYEEAFPLLKERAWPYTVFVNTDGPDGGGGYMSWAQMREMAETSRASFANHSATHDYLVARRSGESESDWESRIRADIRKAEQRLREELAGHVPSSPRLLAYPYGEYDRALQTILDDMGYTAFGQHSGPVGHYSDRLALPRFAMAEAYGDPDDFSLRVNALPLPVASMSPADPTAIDQQDPPELRLEFAETDIALDRIKCFASGRGVVLDWVSESPRILSVKADDPMGEGRSRYNCTVPAQDGGFHWYSYQWIKGRK